ncbi:MAG: hypothetical protein MZW92_68740 [Comamonadaceae bacterium]|nr:hypothetical protein [Comamonadaceae bacterium]
MKITARAVPTDRRAYIRLLADAALRRARSLASLMFFWFRCRISSACSLIRPNSGRKLREIGAAPEIGGPGRIDDVRLERISYCLNRSCSRAAFSPSTGRVMLLSSTMKGLFEGGLIDADELVPLPRVAQKDEEDPAVDALQRFFHLLAGEDAPVVLAQDDVDRDAQLGEMEDALGPDDDDDDEERAESQGYLLA